MLFLIVQYLTRCSRPKAQATRRRQSDDYQYNRQTRVLALFAPIMAIIPITKVTMPPYPKPQLKKKPPLDITVAVASSAPIPIVPNVKL